MAGELSCKQSLCKLFLLQQSHLETSSSTVQRVDSIAVVTTGDYGVVKSVIKAISSASVSGNINNILPKWTGFN